MPEPPASISFDRAVEYYDRTRELPPRVQLLVTDLLHSELREHQPVLEIGVGTGRIALPLVARGLEVEGIDISPAMLARLREKAAAAGLDMPTREADATALPYPDASFGAGLACHVFHLVSDWRLAAAELVRVLRPGGVILVEADATGGRRSRLRPRIRKIVGADRMPATRVTGDEVAAELEQLGLRKRGLPLIRFRHRRSTRDALDQLASNQWSMTWSIADALPEVVRQLTEDAERRLGDLDRPVTETTTIRWQAFDKPRGE